MPALSTQDALDLVEMVDQDLIDKLEMIQELSAHFRRYLKEPANKDYVSSSYCSEFLDCLDTFI